LAVTRKARQRSGVGPLFSPVGGQKAKGVDPGGAYFWPGVAGFSAACWRFEFSPSAYCIVIRRWILGVIMSNEKFSEKMGDAMLDPRHNRIWKGVLWLLGLLLLVDVLLSWYWSQEPDLRELPSRENAVAGETIARELIFVSDTLLSKPGG
jgi:hypothetical protein